MGAADDRLALAKAVPIADVAARLDLAGLRRAGREIVGPCPRCGGDDMPVPPTYGGEDD